MTAPATWKARDTVSASDGDLGATWLPVSDQKSRDALDDHALREPEPAHDGRGT